MAKRKRSTALFEVISKSRQYKPARPATARSGNWFSSAATWFVRPKFQAAEPKPQRTLAAQEMEYDEGPVAVLAEAPEFEEPIAVSAPVEIVKREVPVRAINQDVAVHPSEQETNLRVTMDSDRRQIALKMSYTAAAVAGLALVAVVCLSVMVGQHFGHGNLPILAQTTTDELRRGPAHREVLDPPRRSTVVNSRPAAAETKGAVRNAVPAVSEVHSNAPLSDSKRYAGLNYVVIQSYPESKPEMAEKTAAFLNNHGVNCTVEHDVPGFMRYSVVGLDGFTKISSSEYLSYVEHLKKLSVEYAGSSRSVKAFEPIAKKWQKAE